MLKINILSHYREVPHSGNEVREIVPLSKHERDPAVEALELCNHNREFPLSGGNGQNVAAKKSASTAHTRLTAALDSRNI